MEQSNTRRETVLAVMGLMLVLFLVSLDQTIVGTAMPRIITELKGFEQYAWVTTIYLLAETTVIPIVGKLGDLYGRKWITVAGVGLFLLGSVLCGLATNMTGLIIFRGIQGLGGGMLLSTVFTLIADIFPDPAQRAKYQGFFFAVFALSSVVGPFLGGWITDSLSWRWIFYVNLPLGIVALGILPFVLPNSTPRPGARIDYLGAITITVAVTALLLALSWVGEGDAWRSGRVLTGLAIAAVSFAAFIPIERRAVEPIIPLSLFQNRTFAASAIVVFMVGIGMFGVILYTPLFMQGVLGSSARGSGAVLTPLVLTMTAGGIIGGQLIARVKRIKPFLLFGSVMLTIGVFLLTTLDANTGTGTIIAFLVVVGVGLGLINPTTTLAVQTDIDQRMLGVATSATQFIRTVGATVGTALIGTFVTGGYLDGLQANVPAGTPEQLVTTLRNPDVLVSEQALEGLSRTAAELPNGAQFVEALLVAARTALAGAIREGFVLVLVASALGIAGTLLMPNLHFSDKRAAVPHPEPVATGENAAAAAAHR